MFGQTLFNRPKLDNKLALSIEDINFLNVMDKEVYRDETHSWVAPQAINSLHCNTHWVGSLK